MAPEMSFNEYLSRFPMVLWPVVFPGFILVPLGDYKCERTDRPPAPERNGDELYNACFGCCLYAGFSLVILILVAVIRARSDR